MNKQSIFIAVAAVLLLGLAAWFIWPWCKGREQNATAPLIKQQPEIREITSTGYGYRKEGAIRQALALAKAQMYGCLLYTSPSPRDLSTSRMPSSA